MKSVSSSVEAMRRYRTLAGVSGLAVVLGWLYFPVSRDLVREWVDDWANLGYGLFIPPVAAYLLWERRYTILRSPAGSSWWGYALMLCGLAALLLGRAGGFQAISRGSLIIVLFGLVLFLGGWHLTKSLLFPLLFLAAMVPPPWGIYYRLTWPLQVFTAHFSTAVLRLAGYPVLLQGVYIDLPDIRLEIEAACSGFRSLIALAAIGVLLAFMTRLRWPGRAILIASVVPIAVLANAGRVASNILMGIYGGTYHTVAGWMVFVVGIASLLGIATILEKRYTTGGATL